MLLHDYPDAGSTPCPAFLHGAFSPPRRSSAESADHTKSPTTMHTRAKSMGELSSVIQVIDHDNRMHGSNHNSTPLLPMKQNGGLTISNHRNSLENLDTASNLSTNLGTSQHCSAENIDIDTSISSRQLQLPTPSSIDEEETGTRSGSMSERSEGMAFSPQGSATKTNWLSHLLKGKNKELQLEVEEGSGGKQRSHSIVVMKSENGVTPPSGSSRRISYEESQ